MLLCILKMGKMPKTLMKTRKMYNQIAYFCAFRKWAKCQKRFETNKCKNIIMKTRKNVTGHHAYVYFENGPNAENAYENEKMYAASLLGAQHKKGIVWRTSRQACLLCPWARHLTGRLHLYVVDRWPSRTSPGYKCEVANPACQTTLGYPPVAVRLVGGGATSHSRLVRNGLPSSPSLISIRLTV